VLEYRLMPMPRGGGLPGVGSYGSTAGQVLNPATTGYFLEVKSRTWSRRDAQDKAAIVTELMELLGARPGEAIEEGYVEL